MFRKNKKNQSFLDEEVIVATSKNDKSFMKLKRREVKPIKDIEIVNYPERISDEFKIGDFTFYDNDPQNECTVDDSVVEEVEIIETNKKTKKDLSSFFIESKRYNNMVQVKEPKEKKSNKKHKNVETETINIDNDYSYVFRNVRYTRVEDFIDYLNDNYLEIEKISQEAISDEKLYQWLSKKSYVFDDSVKQFKEIKERIEKK
jgi:hypothetical protein